MDTHSLDYNGLNDIYRQKFFDIFGEASNQSFFSPGRINLIGEHIDYSGGFVFPCAITYGTYAWVRKRSDRMIRMFSDNFASLGVREHTLDQLVFDEADDWANYPKGVLKMMLDKGYDLEFGFDVLFYGNIPNGAGLSSSASLEVLTGLIAAKLNHLGLEMIEIVKLAQKAENDFVGVQCGIMDQFAVGMAQVDTAMLLNTNTLEYHYIPVELGNNVVVIMNTNKRRGLNDSAYNERRAQCELALKALQTVESHDFLCEYSIQFLEKHKELIADPLVYKRAHHAITENERCLKAAKVLKLNDLNAFGKLMNESHCSLRDDYDVTGLELDTIVAAAWSLPQTLGARVTGAGFGGCAIAIVEKDAVSDFIASVGKTYEEAIGYSADFYVASIGQGAHEIL